MPPSDFTVLLKVRHADIDPKLLTEAFGIVPEYCWKAGESKSDGDDTGQTRRESYWVARVPSMPPETPPLPAKYGWLEGTLMWAALMLERRKVFWTKLLAEGASAQLIVLLGQSALTRLEFSHDLLAMLSKSGLSISVDLRDANEAAA